VRACLLTLYSSMRVPAQTPCILGLTVIICPPLAGIRKPKKPPGEHTLADYPGIAEWWHPSKNGGLHPEDYARASNKRVWLQCPGCPSCGEVHQRDVRVSNLTLHSREIACPACECVPGKAFCGCQAVSAHDLLAAEWHEDNPYPATVPLHSGKDVKWRCRRAGCGRIWVAKPRNRCRNLGCPKCS